MTYASPRGMKDLLPGETPRWQQLEAVARALFARYGYAEIRPTLLEQTELFARSIGEASDIVHKEMYTLTDQGGRSLTLRPEATASVVRAGIQHHLIRADQVTKLYYLGPMFRQERPQAGRLRQFHQLGIECFGSQDAMVDVEVMELAMALLGTLGVQELVLYVNHVGCPTCRPAYLEALTLYLQTHHEVLCDDCHYREAHNPLRVFDCKKEPCQKVLADAPKTTQHLCGTCQTHARRVEAMATAIKLPMVQNDRLVRGLDYYTRTTFEVVASGLGAQNAVCGGGRYDHLVKQLGGPEVPGCGFAIGIERLLMVLDQIAPDQESAVSPLALFLASTGPEEEQEAFRWLRTLRHAGFSAEQDTQGKSLKAQLRLADRLQVKGVLIFGEEELAKQSVAVRLLATGEQQVIPLSGLLAFLQKTLKTPARG